MTTFSAPHRERGPRLIRTAEHCQALPSGSDPGVFAAVRKARHLLEGTLKHGQGEG